MLEQFKLEHYKTARTLYRPGFKIDRNQQNCLLLFHQNHLLWLVNLYLLLTSQTCVTSLLPWNLITLVVFVSTVLYNMSLDIFFWIPIPLMR